MLNVDGLFSIVTHACFWVQAFNPVQGSSLHLRVRVCVSRNVALAQVPFVFGVADGFPINVAPLSKWAFLIETLNNDSATIAMHWHSGVVSVPEKELAAAWVLTCRNLFVVAECFA